MDPLADGVRSELSRLGPQAEIQKLAEAWAAAVGEQIARNAWPARVSRDGTLHVHTSSSTWAFELEHLAPEIRERLGPLAPPRLRFAPGPLPEPTTTGVSEASPETLEPSAAEQETASRLAAEIEDEKLRKLVARAAASSLARARSGRTF